MNESINSSEQLIRKLNSVLKENGSSVVNIINDKLTLSVFMELAKSLEKVKEINFIIRDTKYVPSRREISREFEINQNPANLFLSSHEIAEKTKLKHFMKAKSMYDFIKNNINIRRAKVPLTGNIIIVDDNFQIQGSSSLEMSERASKGSLPRINFDTYITNSMDKEQISNNRRKFETIWNNEDYTEDYKEELLESLSYVYKDYSPEFLYYYTLNELFGHQLDTGLEKFESGSGRFKKSKIWNMLFDFQKDAVASAIQKISKYNGCIIADSVGLGKTFEALAIIKYFEERQDNVLVLIPAKLYDNWDSFRGTYVDNPLIDDRFNYKILFHTDLSRTKGKSRDNTDLSRMDWSRFDLIVIDESHNFRNRTENDERMTRYQRLLHEAIKKGLNTKVLLLSATPVNNSLTDLKNQLSIITRDSDHAFEEDGISSVSNLLKRSQREINDWMDTEERSKERLLDRLPPEFFKLLEMTTISRSRKHITDFYGTDKVGKFPNKRKPERKKPEIDTRQELLNFSKTNETLEALRLSVYAPMGYIKSEHKEYYRKKYQTVDGDRVIFYHENRELITTKLHRFNLFKRLESSVYSFSETIRRLIEKIDGFIETISKGNGLGISSEEEDLEEDLVLDYKYEIKVEHLMTDDYLADLYADRVILEKLYEEAKIVLNDNRDEKLKTLRDFILGKTADTPYNDGNRKVLVFTAFADTAEYLYQSLSEELSEHGIHSACVSGSNKPKTTLSGVSKDFNSVLSHFSPISKTGESKPEQIDILIGTDCISEGQNLQDCDCVVNYDIQWNPVVLIQRFGRIDRIGSRNESIAMVNFFPAVELNDYLQLEQRVQGKMMAANIGSTGDEHLLSPEMNDLMFRKKQLERLQEEVVDMDDLNDNISLSDLNMNDYLHELSSYLKTHPEIVRIPNGIYSIAEGEVKGCLLCFKHLSDTGKPSSDSSIYPYYLIYMRADGEVFIGNFNAREALRTFRKIAYGKSELFQELISKFNSETDGAKDMSKYSELLSKAIKSIKGEEEKKAQDSIFDFGGYDNEFANSSEYDFELVSFLIVE